MLATKMEMDFVRSTPFIKSKEQASAKDLLYSAFYFYRGNSAAHQIDKDSYYEKANKLINSLEKNNIPLRLNFMILRAKLFYEMDKEYNDYNISNLENYIKFIQKIKSLNPKHKKFSTNFIKILILLYKYKHKIPNVSLDKIKDKMAKMKAKNSGISNEQWLLEKIEEL